MPFHPNEISENFWQIVEKANKDKKKLELILLEADKNTIYKFAGEFIEASIQLTEGRFLQYLGELSEDSTEDVRNWIVSHGKELYQNIWEHPELISNYKNVKYKEILSGVAEAIYEDKFDEEMPELYNDLGYSIFYDIDL